MSLEDSGDDDVPIVSVIWGLAILAAAAASLLAAGNVEYSLAHNALQITADDAVGEAAIDRAVLGLLDLRPEKRWRVDGIPQEFDFDGRRIRVRIQDELGRIDLNHADGGLLAGLLQAVGLDQASAEALADKIMDWREPTPLKRLNGAKNREYREAGYAYGPRNGPFQSVDELKLVMGMTPAVFARVKPALTVYSGHPRFDPQVAPREALLALPMMDGGKVDALIATRAQQTSGAVYGGTSVAGGGVDPLRDLKGHAFTICTQFDANGHTVTREVAIRISGNPDQPYWVLHWQRR